MTLRALIIDDSPLEIAMLRRALERLGHEVIATGHDAASGLELARSRSPEIAFVDGRLPPDGCLPLLEALVAAAPATKVAVVASLDEIALVRACVGAGAAGAVRRPILQSQVEKSIRSLLERK